MYPVDTFRKTLEKFIAILNVHGVKFHLTGWVTDIAYSEPRMTHGIDIVADVAKLAWIDKGSYKSRHDLRQLIRISTETQLHAIKQPATRLGPEKLLSEVLSEQME